MKTCNKCNTEKELTEFSFRNDSQKYREACKQCRAIQGALYRYDCTQEQFDAMKEKQNNSCGVCGIKAEDVIHKDFKYSPLVIDHCHTTGNIRGLLCPTCNNALGLFHDSIKKLSNAITYLKSTSS